MSITHFNHPSSVAIVYTNVNEPSDVPLVLLGDINSRDQMSTLAGSQKKAY
jgi:hypothetical protein